jgi:ribosomal protein S27AE
MSRPPEDPGDDRPPICPACGVTQFMVVDGDDISFVCLECGFTEGEDGSATV